MIPTNANAMETYVEVWKGISLVWEERKASLWKCLTQRLNLCLGFFTVSATWEVAIEFKKGKLCRIWDNSLPPEAVLCFAEHLALPELETTKR